MPIMRVLQGIAKATLAFHRWFMKYSGTTMIIDNIEERRRLRHTEEPSDTGSSQSDKGSTNPEEGEKATAE